MIDSDKRYKEKRIERRWGGYFGGLLHKFNITE